MCDIFHICKKNMIMAMPSLRVSLTWHDNNGDVGDDGDGDANAGDADDGDGDGDADDGDGDGDDAMCQRPHAV